MSDTITPRLRIKAQPEFAVRAKAVPPPKVRLRVVPSLLPMQIELQNTGTMVQWRYLGQPWQDLIAIDDLDTTVTVGTVTTLPPGSPATVVNVGTAKDMVLNFGIPEGVQGIQGIAATIAVGTTTTVNAGVPASVANVGTPNDAVFNFSIPQGPAATVAVGTVTTLAPGAPATVVNVGTSGAAVLNFGIPQGMPGNVTGPAGAVDNRVAVFDGTTGHLIKDSGALLGNSASRNVGTGAGTVAAGDDGRFGTVPDDYVTNAKLANMPNATVKGRNTAGTGDPEDVTMAQLKALLALVQGDISGLTTGSSPQFAGIELGHATDTTLSRAAAGVIAVEGVPLYSNIPQNSQSAAYTTVLADAQKHLYHPSSDNNARTFTIAANSSVAYPVGTAITFINEINTLSIAINTDTLVFAGTGATGTRTLAANGMATAIKVTTTRWYISGSGLS